MAFTAAGLNIAADALAAAATHLSLHTADPGGTGTSEVAGGTYTREAAVWPAAAAGDTTAAEVTFDIPGGTTVAYWGLWSAVTGGTFLGGFPLSASETFTGDGQYKLTSTIDLD